MSRLNELINELCPNGVEYKTLEDISKCMFRGSGIKRTEVETTGTPCVRYGEIYTEYDIWFDECLSHTNIDAISKPKFFEHGDILFAITGESVEDIAKSTAYMGNEKCLAGGDIVVLKHNENPKYISYALSTSEARKQKSKGKVKSKVVHASIPSLAKIKIPVPPLQIQEEIVKTLDRFTEYTTELQTELKAELEARRQQYEYYRDVLLNRKDFRICCMEDISINRDNKRRPIAAKDRVCGEYPYYGASGIVDYVEDYIFDGDFLLVSEDGANLVARKTPIAFSIHGKNWVNNHAHIFEFNDPYERRFVEIYLNSIDLSAFISGGAQPKLNKKNLNKIKIPLPNRTELKIIVDILDRFDTICNDLDSGLPAEIEMRQKQYEYYRDKLLTFKEYER